LQIQRLQAIIQARDKTLSQSQENLRHVEARAKLAEEQARPVEQQKSRITHLETDVRSWSAKSQVTVQCGYSVTSVYC
jgi:uncharacterized protein (DUF3084 family)